MPSLTVVRADNASFTPSYDPVVVVTGGTSGIGEAVAKLLAKTLHGKVHLILVGRNRAAADTIIASLPLPPTSASQEGEISSETPYKYEFIPCDVTLMKNVHTLASEIKSRVSKINFLVNSAGVSGIGGRDETEEGIDKKLAARYYNKFALTQDLLPLLQAAKDKGEKAGVMNIMGAGQAPEVDLDDLGLKKSYSGFKAMLQSVAYIDLMVAEFAERYPDIAFTHIYPGAVDTPIFVPQNPFARLLMFLFRPILWLVAFSPQDCAEYMVHALLDADKGMNRRNQYADDIGLKAFPKAKDAQKLLWEHSVEVTKV